jgi:hypothetical protein
MAWKLLKFCADGWYVTNFCHWRRLCMVLALLWHSSERQNRNNQGRDANASTQDFEEGSSDVRASICLGFGDTATVVGLCSGTGRTRCGILGVRRVGTHADRGDGIDNFIVTGGT